MNMLSKYIRLSTILMSFLLTTFLFSYTTNADEVYDKAYNYCAAMVEDMHIDRFRVCINSYIEKNDEAWDKCAANNILYNSKAVSYCIDGYNVNNAEPNNSNNALAYFDWALDEEEEYLEVYMQRGDAYNNLGLPDSAIDDYTTALELAKIRKLEDKEQDIYFKLAQVYSIQGKYYKAEQNYIKVLNMNTEYSNYDTVLNNLGETYSKLGLSSDAIRLLSEPSIVNTSTALTHRAYEYFNMKEYDKALVVFSQVIVLDNTSADAYVMRGKTYFWINNFPKAIDDYKMAIKLGGGNEYNLEDINILLYETELAMY